MIQVERDGLRLLAFPALEEAGFRCWISTTPLDVRGAAGRERLARAAGLDPAHVVSPVQIHRADVVRVNGPVEPPQADGVVTDRPDQPLLLRAADCSLVVIADPVRAALGVAHAGWKGSARGIVVNLLQTMHREYGTRPADCLAVVGPTIGPGRYPVGPEVPAAFLKSRGWAKEFVSLREGRLHFDLAGANARFLVECGVPEGAIDLCRTCTYDSPNLLHSYRRDGTGAGHHGVIAAVSSTRR